MSEQWKYMLGIVFMVSIVASRYIIGYFWRKEWQQRFSIPQQRGVGALIVTLAIAQFVFLGEALGGFRHQTPTHPLLYISMWLTGLGWLCGAGIMMETLHPISGYFKRTVRK